MLIDLAVADNLPEVESLDLDVAVANGANLLDSVCPKWFNRVDPDSIELHSCYDCILGQLYDYYDDGIEAVFGKPYENLDEYYENVEFSYGFDCTTLEVHEVKELWIQEINSRKHPN